MREIFQWSRSGIFSYLRTRGTLPLTPLQLQQVEKLAPGVTRVEERALPCPTAVGPAPCLDSTVELLLFAGVWVSSPEGMSIRGLIQPPSLSALWWCGQETDALLSPHSPPLTTISRLGGLILPCTSCSTQKSGRCTYSRQHSRDDRGGKPIQGFRAELVLTLDACCNRWSSQGSVQELTLVVGWGRTGKVQNQGYLVWIGPSLHPPHQLTAGAYKGDSSEDSTLQDLYDTGQQPRVWGPSTDSDTKVGVWTRAVTTNSGE